MDKQPAPKKEGPIDKIQADILKSAKFKGDMPANWRFYFFFRILSDAEMAVTLGGLANLARAGEDELANFKLAIIWPEAAALSAPPPVLDKALAAALPDARVFRNWLKLIVEANEKPFLKLAKTLKTALFPGAEDEGQKGNLAPEAYGPLLQAWITKFEHQYDKVLEDVADELAAGPTPKSPFLLPSLIKYELSRQAAPAFLKHQEPGLKPSLRSENAQRCIKPADIDTMPMNLCFTHAGLSALGLHKNTLESFPDAFKQGMAARAARLNDVGVNAPENWEGDLGQSKVHGFFTGGSSIIGLPGVNEAFWRKLRQEIHLYNDRDTDDAHKLRFSVGLLFRGIGLELLHVELGEQPYAADAPHDEKPRVEHFGFRDGLSQPFVDMGLGDVPYGGQTPSMKSTWTPAAPGEIYLDQPDEDGEIHQTPANPVLREGATFLVFRKLEQDVAGFRDFLKRQKPDDPAAQERLAAEMMGRRKDGTPLAKTASEAGQPTPVGEGVFNDFRYAKDDPMGRKCPLGAHIRRANPRDTGGRNEARRHRILRRGMSFGGPLLPKGEPDDGARRGLLFIAANARIDTQFEVVQADWLADGEFLGQAGLGRCPITGSHAGASRDTFLETGAIAPVMRLPRFVTLRGGDYFYMPGLPALRKMANRGDFQVPVGDLPYNGEAMADPATPGLFEPSRIREYSARLLGGDAPIRLRPRAGEGEVVTFVGKYDEVARVLEARPTHKKDLVDFSVRPYHAVGAVITRGDGFLVGAEVLGDPTRERLKQILEKAWKVLEDRNGKEPGLKARLETLAQQRIDLGLRRTGPAKRIDLIEDIGGQAAYAIVKDLYGVPGPTWLTEMAIAGNFAKQHAGGLPPEWVAALKGERPADPGFVTMRLWSCFVLADLIGNFPNTSDLKPFSTEAGQEMLSHLDSVVALARQSHDSRIIRTLVDAFIHNEKHFVDGPLYRKLHKERPDRVLRYYRDVSANLLEISGSTLAVVPMVFGSIMDFAIEHNIDLRFPLFDLGCPAKMERFIYEADRLSPSQPMRMRRCEVDIDVSTQAAAPHKIKAGDFVAAIVAAANVDEDKFCKPETLALVGMPGSPFRDSTKYLMFGVDGAEKRCWGKDRVALPLLHLCMSAAARLHGLRRVAGPAGKIGDIAKLKVSLPARFTQVGPALTCPAPTSVQTCDKAHPAHRGPERSEATPDQSRA
jgi:Dyp-type peroxidase family